MRSRAVQRPGDGSSCELSSFETPLGWFALLGRQGDLIRIGIGDRTQKSLITRIARQEGLSTREIKLTDWSPLLRRRLIQYADREPVDFSDVELNWPDVMTPFRKRVIAQTRRIPWGMTKTYGEIAELAESPRAARAVGTAMAENRFPIVIPCHRVVASGGRIGGFSAPQGVSLKRQLLAVESDIALRHELEV